MNWLEWIEDFLSGPFFAAGNAIWEYFIGLVQDFLIKSPTSYAPEAWNFVESVLYPWSLSIGMLMLNLFFFIGMFKQASNLRQNFTLEVMVETGIRWAVINMLMLFGMSIIKHVLDIAAAMMSDLFNAGSLTFLTDYNKSKEHLFIRVCDQKKNEEYLKHIVHMPLNGLACTYSVYSTIDENGMSSIQITNRMLSQWGITKEQLHEDALKNMQNIFPPRLFSLTDVVMNIVNDTVEEDHIMIDEPLDCDLYCLTNSRKMNGASYICDEQLMEDIGERFGENYYILPSSLHEVILVPETIGDDVESLQEIVRTVNETTVDERDFLSDDIMLYDIVERKLLPVMAEERKETKTMENDDFKREKTMRFTL